MVEAVAEAEEALEGMDRWTSRMSWRWKGEGEAEGTAGGAGAAAGEGGAGAGTGVAATNLEGRKKEADDPVGV